MVCFRAGGTRYAIAVTATLAVRPASTIIPVPSTTDEHVIGMLPDDPVLAVISPLGAGPEAAHVLVVTTPERDVGLLVDAVTDVCTVPDDRIRAAPDGGVVVAVAERPDGVMLVADAALLVAR
jgi:chemotaxis signal transduction protein